MLVLTSIVSFDNRKVIHDLSTRVGKHNSDSYSYGMGMSYVVEQWCGRNQSQVLTVANLMRNMPDFDADVARPIQDRETEFDEIYEAENSASEVYNPTVHDISFNDYYRRLEDINSAYLEKYIGNQVRSIMFHDEGGIRSYNKLHQSQAVLRSNDDDSDITEVADLIFDRNSEIAYNSNEVAEAIEKLPYVLLRLVNMSALVKIHMPSYIIAYLKAEKQFRNNAMIKKKAKNLTWVDVVRKGVYKADQRTGSATSLVGVATKNKYAEKMFYWINGADKDYAGYYEDYLNLLHYIEVLNIECRTEDFVTINRDYLKDCDIAIVTPNDQYLPEVEDALMHNDTTYNVASNDRTQYITDKLDNITNLLEQAVLLDNDIRAIVTSADFTQLEKVKQDAVTMVFQYYLSNNEVIDYKNCKWVNGFLYYNNEIVRLPVSCIKYAEAINRESFVFSEYGFVVKFTDESFLEIMHMECAFDNFKEALKGHYDEQDYDWSRIFI